MIILAATAVGTCWGWFLAAGRKGGVRDKLQYAAGFAIAFGLAGLILTIVLGRSV